jgi:hypothetical protein
MNYSIGLYAFNSILFLGAYGVVCVRDENADTSHTLTDSAALICSNNDSTWKATRAVLKRSHMCIVNAGRHFEKQRSQLRKLYQKSRWTCVRN